MKRLFLLFFFFIVSSTFALFSSGLVFDFGMGYGSNFDMVKKDEAIEFGTKGEAVYTVSLSNGLDYFFPLRINGFLISDKIDFWEKNNNGRLSFAAELRIFGGHIFSLNLGGGVIKEVRASSDDDKASIIAVFTSTADLVIDKTLCFELFCIAPMRQVTARLGQFIGIKVSDIDSIQPAVAGIILKYRLI